MATIPTPEQGKPILDFSAGTFDGNSNLIQSRNGATEHVNGDDVADYVNTSRIYNTLETESKTPVGAINEVKGKINNLQTAIFKISAELTGSTVNINADSWGDSIVDIPLITGYRPIAFYKVYPNSPTALCINSFDIEYTSTSNFGRIRLRNLSSSTISAYAKVSILYLRA